jgi:hypothetical protein
LRRPETLGTRAAIRSFVAAGEEARVVDELPLELALVDARIAVFTLDDPAAGEPTPTITTVEHPALAHLPTIAFESAWESAEP